MRWLLGPLLLLVMQSVYAVDRSRCGTDPFGNIVCMDKDGVLFQVPSSYVQEDALQSASAVSDADKQRREAIREMVRCGIDPFGNKVCR
jgi:hypothetical protein